MSKDTIIGLVLIGAILIGWSICNQPTEEELEAMKKRQDSIAVLKAETESAIAATLSDSLLYDTLLTTSSSVPTESSSSDSLTKAQLLIRLGSFANVASGETEYFTIENEKIKATISAQGGRIVSVELKEYQTHDSLPLLLFDEDSSSFGINFYEGNSYIQTDKLFFKPTGSSFEVKDDETKKFGMRLYSSSEDRYIEYLYTLKGNSYMLDFTVSAVGLDAMLAERKNERKVGLDWYINALSKEKSIDVERMTTTVFFKYTGSEEVDYISESSSEVIKPDARLHWFSFKQQFFSVALIAEQGFDKFNSQLETRNYEHSDKYTKYLGVNLILEFEKGSAATFPMTFYLGPNHYQTLKSYDIELEEQIDLGWWIIGWINEYLVIPVFNFLDGFNMNYGIIILILTFIIKLILFPITYKTYKSSAKMRVLKPEIDEINEKHKKDDAMKRQQATMALYKKAGVNPMAGCIPMLLQMPVLYAMFRFFPSSIELRQQGFLWAEDLSSYDSILQLGFSIPFYGDHVSLFTLLMAGSTFLYTKYNMQMSAQGPQMAQMKIMIYFMPIMLLAFFNSFACGLTFYYFAANIISVAQQFVIKKWFIDEEAILRKIQEHKKKPGSSKKSSFQKRLENMQRKREQQMRGKKRK